MITLDDAQTHFKHLAGQLVAGEYAEARLLLSDETANDWTTDRLAQTWTHMVLDPGQARMFEDAVAVDDMAGWPERLPDDVAWVYVPIVTDTFNEGVSGVVMVTPRGPLVRALTFGRID